MQKESRTQKAEQRPDARDARPPVDPILLVQLVDSGELSSSKCNSQINVV